MLDSVSYIVDKIHFEFKYENTTLQELGCSTVNAEDFDKASLKRSVVLAVQQQKKTHGSYYKILLSATLIYILFKVHLFVKFFSLSEAVRTQVGYRQLI